MQIAERIASLRIRVSQLAEDASALPQAAFEAAAAGTTSWEAAGYADEGVAHIRLALLSLQKAGDTSAAPVSTSSAEAQRLLDAYNAAASAKA